MLLAFPAQAAIGFQPYQAYPVGSKPESVAIGDVTGDGRSDVLLSTSGYYDPDDDFNLFVFAQQPNGSLAPPEQFPTHANLSSDDLGVAAADLNGDGATDVAVTTRYGVDLFFQSGGTLDGPTLLPGTAKSQQVEAADLDADGDQDLVIRAGFDGVLVARNDGSSFTVTSPTDANQTEVEIGDVTGDGRLDIVGFENRYLHVFPQALDGSFGGPIVYEAAVDYYPNGKGLEVADVTGDGRQDAVLSIGGNRPGSLLNVFAQNAAGTLNPPVVYPSYDIPEPVEALDMDEDGRTDVMTLHGGWEEAGFYLQRPNGTLGVEALFGVPYSSHYNAKGLALGDVQRRRLAGHRDGGPRQRARGASPVRPAAASAAASPSSTAAASSSATARAPARDSAAASPTPAAGDVSCSSCHRTPARRSVTPDPTMRAARSAACGAYVRRDAAAASSPSRREPAGLFERRTPVTLRVSR